MRRPRQGRHPDASRTAAVARRALPAAPAIRPQFGSRPCAAALTRLDDTTARAKARASASSRAPVTTAEMSVVAPSPSAACWRARSRATVSIAAPSAAACGVPGSTAAAPAAPEASTKTVSLVLVSPSTDSWFQVRAAIGRRSPQSVSGAAVASVRTTDSIVAIWGWIIPTPLAMPLTVTVHGEPRPSAGQIDGCRRRLGHRIGRAQRDRGPEQPVVICRDPRNQVLQPGCDALQRESRADDSRREVERPLRRRPGRVRQQPGDFELIGVARRAGCGVGAAARRDDRFGPAEPAASIAGRGRQVGARQAYGRGRERVGREDRGDRGRSVGRRDQGEVGPPGRLDPGRQPTGLEAGRQGGVSLDRWEVRRGRRDGDVRDGGHGTRGSCSRPAVSGRPWTRLNAWIACPAAPLTRLSSTPMARMRFGPLVVA